MADDYLADTGTTGTVAIGGSASGEIESEVGQKRPAPRAGSIAFGT